MDPEVMCIHCLASISDNQKKTVLSCGHRFHFACQFEHRLEIGINRCLVCNSVDDGEKPLSNVLTEDRQPIITQPSFVPTMPPTYLNNTASQRPPFPQPVQSNILPRSDVQNYVPRQFIPNDPHVNIDGREYRTTLLSLPMAPQRSRSRSPVPTSGNYKKRCYYFENCRNTFCSYRHPEKCNFDIICHNDYCQRWHPLRNKQKHDEEYLSD